METVTESDELVESAIEFEDIDLSDTEDTDNKELDAVPLTIDDNSRIISNISSAYYSDMQLCERESNHCTFQVSGTDLSRNTSSDELDFSDDGADSFKLKEINLDSIFSGINHQFESSSSFDHSSTVFKKRSLIDSEYISDDDVNIFERRSVFAADNRAKNVTSSLSVAGVFASVRDFFSGKTEALTTLNVRNSLFLENDKPVEAESPLMTCVEFLNAGHSDDEDTDEEILSMDLSDAKGIRGHTSSTTTSNHTNGGASILDDALRCRGKGNFMAQFQNNTRRSSWTTELLSDDDYTSTGNNTGTGQSKTKKRNSLSNVLKDPNECLTDEEIVDLDDKEWSESDESGGVRQITQIKTETSIKLEDAVKSLRKVPEKEASDSDRKGSTDSEADDLSFTEKKSYFQRLSLTSENIPGSNKYIQDVSLDDLPMAEGEIIEEKISFEDKLKMFEPDEDNRKKIQKRDKQEQPTVYRYDFTKNGKERMDVTEYAVSELEKAEEIVKQVSEELTEEESRLTSNFAGDNADSAITLEKVEQEVYSLIAEVDREEKRLSKGSYDSENENVASGSEADHHEDSLSEVMGEESFLSRQSLEQETFASKLEVEGDGSALDGDSLVSTTTSTTTRVVTSVVSDPDGQSEFQSTFVQQLSDDDIRQSCEITVNEVLNDNATPKPEEPVHDE